MLKTVIQVFGVPLVLTTVAVRQVVLARTAGLSPWHGGGFGMFASIDRDEWRQLETTLVACDGNPVVLDSDKVSQILGEKSYIHLTTLPTSAQLQFAGQRLIDAQAPGCVRQVQLQVSRLIFKDNTIVYEPVSPLIEVQP